MAFSSDLKPFKNLNFYKKDINKYALKSYLKYNYVPAPITIFENTFKVKSALIDINLKKYNFKTLNHIKIFWMINILKQKMVDFSEKYSKTKNRNK